MKHPNLLDGLEPALATPIPHIGGLVGVGFAGGGGSSEGLKKAGLTVDFAMNHDAAAIAMHVANHPQALHFCQDIWQVRPENVEPGRPIRIMWFSPDCKHFSIAKGGTPVDKQIRDLAWVILLWAKLRRPDVILMENVREFMGWGPLIEVDGELVPDPKRKGEYFRAFCRELRKLGYVIDFKIMVCADYGDPTSRTRMFGQFRCDGQPITWPEPTHGAPNDPDVIAGRKLPWRTAASHVLDFSQPCHSIFMTREEARAGKIRINRPLVDATFARVTLGLERHVLEAAQPYIIKITHGSAAPAARRVDAPLYGQTCAKGGEHALAVPSLVPLTHQGAPRAHGAEEPTRTMTAANRGEIAMSAAFVTKFRRDSAGTAATDPIPTVSANSFQKKPGGAAPLGIAAVHMVQHNAGPNNGGLAGRPTTEPVSTLTTAGAQQNVCASYLAHFRGSGDRSGNDVRERVVTQTAGGTHVAEVRTFLVKYYKSAEVGQHTNEPVHAVTTKARFALIEVSTADVIMTEEQRYTAYWVARLIDVYGHPEGKPKRRRRKGFGSLHYRTLIDRIDAMHRPRPSAVGRDGWIVWDIGMRMLTVRERFRAQGVTDDYIIDVEVDGKPISATKQGEMCGNMVPPNTAEAIARAALPELRAQPVGVAA
ncbi:DNA cytosine methyltransferase [Sphingomonas oryzagri]|uniref:DNA (cytosine-5-)-methyltransferase n=1 Tax=Sphingomonas oryzagri TaxID=3042314 RepID=A0ABT6N631_9SPHN|nr:DNA cytosine methyltransferase [Sphingomonas oryzagri]MDH7640550.1 DNA cytosine methyltransferase [Sphingomonas oryzagri]